MQWLKCNVLKTIYRPREAFICQTDTQCHDAIEIKCGHMTHHSKAENVGIAHLCILMESSGYFGHSLFQRLCRWSCDLFETKIESAAFWIYHMRWLRHSIPVSLVASRCVRDKRQHETWSRKKLSEHPCVRTQRSKFPNVESSTVGIRSRYRICKTALHYLHLLFLVFA